MISFVFRFVFISFLGMLFDPTQLAHRLPTKAQITHIRDEIQNTEMLKHTIVKQMSGLQRGYKELRETTQEIAAAAMQIRKSIDTEEKSEKRRVRD